MFRALGLGTWAQGFGIGAPGLVLHGVHGAQHFRLT